MSLPHRHSTGRLRSTLRGSAHRATAARNTALRNTALRGSTIAVTLALIATSPPLGAGPAAAVAPMSAPQTAPTTAPTVPVMIVLDASGSMNQTDAPGPRIDAAKAAVTTLIDGLPASTQVGLQVYGTGTGSTDGEKTAGCTDIKTLAPVGPLDEGALKGQVASVVAAG